MARRALQPLDVTLRYGRLQQLARRAVLGVSVLLTFGVPLWHLRAIELAGARTAPQSPWTAVSAWLPSLPPPLVGAPTAIRLWVVELIDPLAALGVALARGVSWSWAAAVVPGLLLVLALGRFFCGWACPYLPLLAASNAARWVMSKLGVPLLDVRVPRVAARVAAVGLLVGTAVTGTHLLPLVYPPALIGREVFRAVFTGSLGAGALVVACAVAFDTFISRAGFCRSLCPGGAMFSTVGSLSPLRIARDPAKCTDCTVCDVVCNLGQSPMTSKLDAGCERCGRCIASCPTKALSWQLGRPSAFRGPEEKP